jgi:hypothetical protein
MIVIERRGGARLAQKAFLRRHVRRRVRRLLRRGQHCLQGDESFEPRILGLEDDPHAAGAENLQHAIRPESAELVGRLRRGQERVEFSLRLGAVVQPVRTAGIRLGSHQGTLSA